MVQNVKLVESNIKIATAFLNTNLKGNLIEYKCLRCNKNCHQNFDEYFKKRFFNTCRFLPMISLSLFYCCQKVHLYEYMIGWENFGEPSLPEKEDFYSHLNMEDITDAD